MFLDLEVIMTRTYAYNTVKEIMEAEWAESALSMIVSTLFLNSTMNESVIEDTVEELGPKFMEAEIIYFASEDYGTTFKFEKNERVDNFNSWMTKMLGMINFINENGIRFDNINEDHTGFISGEWEIHI